MHKTRQFTGTLLLVLAAGVALSGCQSLSTGSSNSSTVRATVTSTPGFNLRWQLQIPMEQPKNETVRNVWRVGPRLYVATSENRLYCVDASSGTLGWMAPLGDPSLPLLKPQDVTVNNNTDLLVLTRTQAKLLDLSNGEVINKRNLAFAAASDPVVAGDVVCVGGADSYFRGLYIDLLGMEKWRVWREKDAFSSTPALTDGDYVLFASINGFISYVSAETAGTNGSWERRTGGQIIAGVAADAKNAYIASLDNKVYAFDLNTGEPLWQTFVEGRLDQTPVVVGSTVVVIGSGKGATGLSSDKGDIKWNSPTVTAITAHNADHAYAVDTSNNLLAINADTGAVDGTFPLGSVQAVAHNSVDPTTYTISPGGLLLAVEPAK